MKRFAFPAVVLFLFVISRPVHAQTLEAADVHQVNPVVPQPGPSPQPVMTPQQVAEMRADIFVARKMYPQAIRVYLQLVKTDKKNTVLLNKLGVTYEDYGNKGRAEHWFKQAIKTNKTFASAYNNVGTVEYAKHHYKNAVKWYQKALQLQPDGSVVAPAYSNMGYAYFAWKKYPQAISAFENALEIDPRILTEAGSANGSILRQTGTTDPGLFYFFVARTYALLGDAAPAAHYLKMARDIGYKNFISAKTDPAFAKIIKDPRVQAVFQPVATMSSSRHN